MLALVFSSTYAYFLMSTACFFSHMRKPLRKLLLALKRVPA